MGIFSGILDPQQLRDGKIKRSGYCNVSSVKEIKSLQRRKTMDWGPYTHLILRIRGDGRNYLLTLATPGPFDILWNDSYQYVLHTRGGPYWQYTKIPFSRFFLVSKGRIQDSQESVPKEHIVSFGITCADKIPGKFKLEIDFIGVENDQVHTEEFAYEMYNQENKYTC